MERKNRGILKNKLFLYLTEFFRNVCDGGRTWCEQAACLVF